MGASEMSASMSPNARQAGHAVTTRGIGWYGMVFFLASEAFFFANLIASYLYLRVRNGPMAGPEHLNIILAAANTVILLSSSFPMHWAARGITNGDRRRLATGLILTAMLGALFVSGQIAEYFLLVNEGLDPTTNVFGSAFFTMTGFHGAHVTAGVIFLTVLFVRTQRGNFSRESHFAVTAGEMYWHFVDAVWIVLFSVLYLSNISSILQH
jgi:heme/copper-type cytochrome/quinol oxidase subunit 3